MGVYPSVKESGSRKFWMGLEIGGPTGCWTWLRGKTSDGYGHLSHYGRQTYVHRFAYEMLVGPIPEGLQLDHLCRNTSCANPDHLEPVTNRENARRGLKAQRTRCAHGHLFDERTIIYRGYRRCRVCRDNRNAARYRKGTGDESI